MAALFPHCPVFHPYVAMHQAIPIHTYRELISSSRFPSLQMIAPKWICPLVLDLCSISSHYLSFILITLWQRPYLLLLLWLSTSSCSSFSLAASNTISSAYCRLLLAVPFWEHDSVSYKIHLHHWRHHFQRPVSNCIETRSCALAKDMNQINGFIDSSKTECSTASNVILCLISYSFLQMEGFYYNLLGVHIYI